ncbi:MAG TPA: hypothetical protein VMR25_15990, partial [Planctomycetaceae bacterium]|nr:hypothetical protein [Planctomycetaceae bacterium]
GKHALLPADPPPAWIALLTNINTIVAIGAGTAGLLGVLLAVLSRRGGNSLTNKIMAISLEKNPKVAAESIAQLRKELDDRLRGGLLRPSRVGFARWQQLSVLLDEQAREARARAVGDFIARVHDIRFAANYGRACSAAMEVKRDAYQSLIDRQIEQSDYDFVERLLESAIEPESHADHEEPTLRAQKMVDVHQIERLIETVRNGRHRDAVEATNALIRNSSALPEAMPLLLEAASDGDLWVEKVAYALLLEVGEPGINSLLEAMFSDRLQCACAAGWVIREYCRDERCLDMGAAVPRLSEIAKSSAHADVRLLAVESLGEIVPRIEAIVSALEAAMNDNDDQVRSAATAALHGGVPLHDQKRRPLETPQFELASTTKSSE